MTGDPISFSRWWQSRRNPFWNATETVKHSTEELARAAFTAGAEWYRQDLAHKRKHRDDFSFTEITASINPQTSVINILDDANHADGA